MENIIEKQKYLWKYLSLDKFNSLLKDKALYLPSLKRLQLFMDPIEGATSKRLVNSAIKQIEKYKNMTVSISHYPTNIDKSLLKLQDECINLCKKFGEARITYAYIYSMAYSENENYALWNIYPTDLKGNVQINQGLSLRMNEEYFKELFVNKNIKVDNNKYHLDISMPILENVLYKSKQEISEIINADNQTKPDEFMKILHNVLLIKNDFYDFAKEKRYIVNLEYDANAIKNCEYSSDKSFIQVQYETSKFFNPDYCKIIISPFANDTLLDYTKYLLEKNNIKFIDDIVYKSEIAVPN